MEHEELLIYKKLKAEERKRQRVTHKQKYPMAYEFTKLKNRLTTALYDKKKRNKRQSMTKEEVVADRLLKAVSRRKQRLKKKLITIGSNIGGTHSK